MRATNHRAADRSQRGQAWIQTQRHQDPARYPAHFDHAAGFAKLKKLTGAQLMISAPDVPMIEAGGRGDFVIPDAESAFPPVKVDRALNDDAVRGEARQT